METKFAKYKKLIELQLQELTAEDELGQSSQRTVELDQQSVGRLSRMDALQSQAMAQAQQRRRDTLKTSLVAALQRLEEEEFGYCGLRRCDRRSSSLSQPSHFKVYVLPQRLASVCEVTAAVLSEWMAGYKTTAPRSCKTSTRHFFTRGLR